MQISWLYNLVQSWSWSLDVTRSSAGKTANVHKPVAFVLFRQKALSKREICFQLSTAQLWVTAFYFSVILITLVAFSHSGKEHTLVMTECIILSIGRSHGCKRNKYLTYTFQCVAEDHHKLAVNQCLYTRNLMDKQDECSYFGSFRQNQKHS